MIANCFTLQSKYRFFALVAK